MKRRLNAILLALGLGVSVFAMGVYAEETESAETEQVSESAETEQVSESAEAESTAVDGTESEEAGTAGTEAADETEAASMTAEEYYLSVMEQYLTYISAYTEEQVESLAASTDASTAAVFTNWKSVMSEVGTFVGVTELTDVQYTADGTSISEITCIADYDGVGDTTTVTVSYIIDNDAGTYTIEWEVDYPMGILMQRAALNTIMGIAIVFLVLLFLSWLIGKMHIIPDTIEKMSKKNAPAASETPAPLPAAEPVVEEELTDDLELVAVITAAIAASENTSADGFVVRSIKKANKRNWQRA